MSPRALHTLKNFTDKVCRDDASSSPCLKGVYHSCRVGDRPLDLSESLGPRDCDGWPFKASFAVFTIASKDISDQDPTIPRPGSGMSPRRASCAVQGRGKSPGTISGKSTNFHFAVAH